MDNFFDNNYKWISRNCLNLLSKKMPKFTAKGNEKLVERQSTEREDMATSETTRRDETKGWRTIWSARVWLGS